MKRIILCGLGLFFTYSGVAQFQVSPTSEEYHFDLGSFGAEYNQMGNTMFVDSRLSTDGQVYNITMRMPDLSNPSRIITDVIGVSSKNGAFIYRDFHLPMPKWSYNRANYSDGKIHHVIYSETGVSSEEVEASAEVFDGTFAYWQLSGVDGEIGSFGLNRWKKSGSGLEAGISPHFKMEGTEEVRVGERIFYCRRYTVEPTNGIAVISYVSDEAPYLIRQDYTRGEQKMTILELVRVLN